MIPELGHFALIVALLLALTQAILPLYGAQRGNLTLMAVARPAAQGQFMFVALAFGCLAWSFQHNDFSVLNVAKNSFSHKAVFSWRCQVGTTSTLGRPACSASATSPPSCAPSNAQAARP